MASSRALMGITAGSAPNKIMGANSMVWLMIISMICERENWGLGYEYPRDYFMQHAFSVKRFDEKKLLKYKWFERYYNLRPAILSLLLSPWKKHYSKTDATPPSATIDTTITTHPQEEILQ